MEPMTEIEKMFIDAFSNANIVTDSLPSRIELPADSNFLTNEIGIKYIGNLLKDIDIRLYLVFIKMLKSNINFINNYDVENSVCESEISYGVTRDVKINVPNIRNGMDILATAHELGHGLKSFTKVNNERHLHSNTIFNETISILFGRLCTERYTTDFGYNDYAEQFDLLNIKNAIKCLEKIKTLLPEYVKKQNALNNSTAKIIKNPKYDDYKYRYFVREVEDLKNQLYVLISYPIGISLANVYDNFDRSQKEKYLEFVSKFLLNIKHIDFEMILEYFNIPFDATIYIQNFNEYIQKFENRNDKKLVLRGQK